MEKKERKDKNMRDFGFRVRTEEEGKLEVTKMARKGRMKEN